MKDSFKGANGGGSSKPLILSDIDGTIFNVNEEMPFNRPLIDLLAKFAATGAFDVGLVSANPQKAQVTIDRFLPRFNVDPKLFGPVKTRDSYKDHVVYILFDNEHGRDGLNVHHRMEPTGGHIDVLAGDPGLALKPKGP